MQAIQFLGTISLSLLLIVSFSANSVFAMDGEKKRPADEYFGTESTNKKQRSQATFDDISFSDFDKSDEPIDWHNLVPRSPTLADLANFLENEDFSKAEVPLASNAHLCQPLPPDESYQVTESPAQNALMPYTDPIPLPTNSAKRHYTTKYGCTFSIDYQGNIILSDAQNNRYLFFSPSQGKTPFLQCFFGICPEEKYCYVWYNRLLTKHSYSEIFVYIIRLTPPYEMTEHIVCECIDQKLTGNGGYLFRLDNINLFSVTFGKNGIQGKLFVDNFGNPLSISGEIKICDSKCGIYEFEVGNHRYRIGKNGKLQWDYSPSVAIQPSKRLASQYSPVTTSSICGSLCPALQHHPAQPAAHPQQAPHQLPTTTTTTQTTSHAQQPPVFTIPAATRRQLQAQQPPMPGPQSQPMPLMWHPSHFGSTTTTSTTRTTSHTQQSLIPPMQQNWQTCYYQHHPYNSTATMPQPGNLQPTQGLQYTDPTQLAAHSHQQPVSPCYPPAIIQPHAQQPSIPGPQCLSFAGELKLAQACQTAPSAQQPRNSWLQLMKSIKQNQNSDLILNQLLHHKIDKITSSGATEEEKLQKIKMLLATIELRAAIRGKQKETIVELLQEHPDLHQTNYPTLYAIAELDDESDEPDLSIIHLLLEKGANVNAITTSFPFQTPLHWAAEIGCVLLAYLLREYGAEPFVRNIQGTQVDSPLATKGLSQDFLKVFIDNNSECPVCFRNIQSCGLDIKAERCGHILCKQCFKKIKAGSQSCPICRQPL